MRCNSGVTAAISHKAYHSEDIDMKIRMSILVAVLFLGYTYTPGIAAPQPPNNIFDLLGLVSGRNNKILFITGPVDKVTAVKMNAKGAANW